MSDAARVLAAYTRSLARVGEDISVRRFTGVGVSRTHADTTVRARVMDYQEKEITGDIIHGDRKVITLVDTLTSLLPLTVNDKLIVRGTEMRIKAIDDNTIRVQGTLIALKIQASGG